MKKALTFLVLLLPLLLASAAQQSAYDALAADIPVPGSAGDTSIQGYGDRDKTCAEWTDGCRTCQRGADDEPACSNIGPACQPAAIKCARRK